MTVLLEEPAVLIPLTGRIFFAPLSVEWPTDERLLANDYIPSEADGWLRFGLVAREGIHWEETAPDAMATWHARGKKISGGPGSMTLKAVAAESSDNITLLQANAMPEEGYTVLNGREFGRSRFKVYVEELFRGGLVRRRLGIARARVKESGSARGEGKSYEVLFSFAREDNWGGLVKSKTFRPGPPPPPPVPDTLSLYKLRPGMRKAPTAILSNSNLGFTVRKVYYTRFVFERPTPVDGLYIATSSTGTFPTKGATLGLYSSNDWGEPGNKIIQFGDTAWIANSSMGAFLPGGSSTMLEPGEYWSAVTPWDTSTTSGTTTNNYFRCYPKNDSRAYVSGSPWGTSFSYVDGYAETVATNKMLPDVATPQYEGRTIQAFLRIGNDIL